MRFIGHINEVFFVVLRAQWGSIVTEGPRKKHRLYGIRDTLDKIKTVSKISPERAMINIAQGTALGKSASYNNKPCNGITIKMNY